MNNWLSKNIGQVALSPEPPHGVQGQCVNAASSYSLSIGGPELTGPTAWSIWTNFIDPFYTKITTTSLRPGDIVFFDQNNINVGTGTAGHIDICVNLTPTGFRGADTNWANNPKLEYVDHNLTGVAGVFRIKGEDSMQVTKAVLDSLYRGILMRDPDPGAYTTWVGQDIGVVLSGLLNSPERANIVTQFDAGANAPAVPTVIVNGKNYVPKT